MNKTTGIEDIIMTIKKYQSQTSNRIMKPYYKIEHHSASAIPILLRNKKN
jgi:hypothetical protein